MRLATIWNDQAGLARPAVELPDGSLVDLAEIVGTATARDSGPPSYTLRMIDALEHLDEIRRAVTHWLCTQPGRASNSPRSSAGHYLPPIPVPPTFRDFYAFEQHVATCRARRGLGMDPAWYQQPVFYFSNPTCFVGHDQPVHAPAGCEELDYELELALVIGRAGRDIPACDAWKHVAGFTILDDFSARDLQRREMPLGLGPAKGKDFATAAGPFLVTLDEVAGRIDDAGGIHLRMSARVNGRQLSAGDASAMYFTWPKIIEHASRDAWLLPGDLLGSGTVGSGCILELGPENANGWLRPGDVVELEVERLGVLRTPIVARPTDVRHAQGVQSTAAHHGPGGVRTVDALGTGAQPVPEKPPRGTGRAPAGGSAGALVSPVCSGYVELPAKRLPAPCQQIRGTGAPPVAPSLNPEPRTPEP